VGCEMNRPGYFAARRIWEYFLDMAHSGAAARSGEEHCQDIQRIIEEEFSRKIREDHHGPKQGTYMRRALKNG